MAPTLEGAMAPTLGGAMAPTLGGAMAPVEGVLVGPVGSVDDRQPAPAGGGVKLDGRVAKGPRDATVRSSGRTRARSSDWMAGTASRVDIRPWQRAECRSIKGPPAETPSEADCDDDRTQ